MTATAVATADFAFVAQLPATIRTARLVLRAPNRKDIAAMARLANNFEIFKRLSRLPHPYGEADAIAFIDGMARSDTNHSYAILDRDEVFLGVAGFHIEPNDETLELGYWLGEPYWGDGYGSEAVAALVAAADGAGCDRIAARAQTSNIASCRVLEKSGFVETSRHIADCGPHKGVSVTYFSREPMR